MPESDSSCIFRFMRNSNKSYILKMCCCFSSSWKLYSFTFYIWVWDALGVNFFEEGVRLRSRLAFWLMDVQMHQHRFWQDLSFLCWIAFAPSSIIVHICVGLFLGSLFCPIDPCTCHPNGGGVAPWLAAFWIQDPQTTLGSLCLAQRRPGSSSQQAFYEGFPQSCSGEHFLPKTKT